MTLIRIIVWTIALAYCGSFVFAGRGVRSLHDASVSGGLCTPERTVRQKSELSALGYWPGA